MDKELIKCLLIRLLILTALSGQIFAQTSAYHSIVFPYETGSAINNGGLMNTATGPLSDPLTNPGGLAFSAKPFISLNYKMQKSWYGFKYEYGIAAEDQSVFTNNPGSLSALFPFSFNDKFFVLGFSGQYITAPEIELPDAMPWDEMTRIEHDRKDNVGNANLALSGRITENFGIGLNISRWFGNWKWNDYINAENFGSGTFSYSGTNFSLGALYQWSRLKIGLTLHSPFTLMSSDNTQLTSWFVNTQSRHIEQKFDGAGRLGLAYTLFRQTQIGIGYRLQGKIYLTSRFPDDNHSPLQDTYGVSHQFSASVNQELGWRTVKLPFFIAYQMTFMPVNDSQRISDYQRITFSDNDNPEHAVSVGLNIFYRSIGLNLAGKWRRGTVSVTNNATPSWS